MKPFRLLFLVLVNLSFLVGCGIKGNPQPPFEPATLGRGRPSFKKVGKELNINEKTEKSSKEEPDEKL